MKLSRRAIFAVPVMIGTLGKTSLVSAADAPVVDSGNNLLFRKLKFPIHTLRVGTGNDEGGLRTLRFMIDRIGEEDTKEFASIRHLITETFNVVEVGVDDVADKKTFAVILNREMTRIAARTRRGVGNIVWQTPNSLFPNIARENGHPYEFLRVETISALQDDELLLMHSHNRGIFEGPFMAEVRDNGSVRAALMNRTPDTLGDSSDYGVLLKIKRA